MFVSLGWFIERVSALTFYIILEIHLIFWADYFRLCFVFLDKWLKVMGQSSVFIWNIIVVNFYIQVPTHHSHSTEIFRIPYLVLGVKFWISYIYKASILPAVLYFLHSPHPNVIFIKSLQIQHLDERTVAKGQLGLQHGIGIMRFFYRGRWVQESVVGKQTTHSSGEVILNCLLNAIAAYLSIKIFCKWYWFCEKF